MTLLRFTPMLLAKLLCFDFDEPLLLLKALSLLPGPTLPLSVDVLAPPGPMPNLLFTRFNLVPLLRQLTREVSARSR
jgi:hypothetical protein